MAHIIKKMESTRNENILKKKKEKQNNKKVQKDVQHKDLQLQFLTHKKSKNQGDTFWLKCATDNRDEHQRETDCQYVCMQNSLWLKARNYMFSEYELL